VAAVVTEALSIRSATRADEQALMTLSKRMANFAVPAWRSASEITDADGRSMVNAVELAHPDSEVFIAERDGQVAGCLHMLVSRDFFGRRHAHISVIAVSDAAEGTGAGRTLMAYAERWARDRGLHVITLNVFAANARARRLYEKAGFEIELLKYAKPL
jgi:ribosomal protein S18 acetylase RimI-like enzyme